MKKIHLTSLIYLFALFFSNNYLQAQNFAKGYILQNSKDTLKGYLEDLKANQKSQIVHFKTNLAQKEVIIYNPETIKGYGYDSTDVYLSIEVEFSSEIRKKVFCKELIKGYMSLFATTSPLNGRDVFIIQKNAGDFATLFMNKMQDMEVFNSGYLKAVLADCKETKSKFSNGRLYQYTEEDIIMLIQSYNTCMQNNPTNAIGTTNQQSSQTAQIIRKPLPKVKLQVGLLVGVNFTQTNILSPSKLFGIESLPFAPSYLVGGFANFSGKKKFALQAEIFYEKRAVRIDQFSPNNFTKVTINSNTGYLNIVILPRLTFKPIYIESGLGLSVNASFGTASMAIQSTATSNYEVVFLSTTNVAFLAGIGVNLKVGKLNISPKLRYQRVGNNVESLENITEHTIQGLLCIGI